MVALRVLLSTRKFERLCGLQTLGAVIGEIERLDNENFELAHELILEQRRAAWAI